MSAEAPPRSGRAFASGEAGNAREALSRAARHLRNASAETALAVRALLDALSLVQGGVPAESHALLSRVAVWLDALARGLGGDDRDAALPRALAEALDAEIARWEERAREDPDARAVLRAFLGLRELLWELGVRPAPPHDADGNGGPDAGGEGPKRPRRGGGRRRVERVPVQG